MVYTIFFRQVIISMTYTRKLTKTAGYSYIVSVPKQLVEKYGWKEHQKLSIKDMGRGRLEVRDWKRR
ncbi:MAG: hypothetical protein NUV59_01685 [Patescibacteria group bacterium]|nr:hypothetical protein [Patescibacteria group bacterium]